MTAELRSRPAPAEQRVALKELRVAVASDAAPERNGVGAYYQDLLEYLTPCLERVEVFSPTIDERGEWSAGLVLPMPGDATQRLCFPNPFALRRDLKALEPHAVIVPTPGVYGLWGAFVAARLGIPVIAGFHTSFEKLTDLYWQGSLKGRFYRQYLERSNRYLFNLSSAILVNSKEMADLAHRAGGSNVEMMGTPVSTVFTAEPTRLYSGRLDRVLFAGRLAEEKNIDAIIEAAATIHRVRFSIAGDGPLRDMVRSACGGLSNLEYLGWLDRDRLREQIDEHDALILPSHFESFGTIALEAMSRHRVAIVSRGCGITGWPELAEGMVVLESSESLANKLKELLAESDACRKSIADRGLTVATRFNERNVQGWKDLLARVASR